MAALYKVNFAGGYGGDVVNSILIDFDVGRSIRVLQSESSYTVDWILAMKVFGASLVAGSCHSIGNSVPAHDVFGHNRSYNPNRGTHGQRRIIQTGM